MQIVAEAGAFPNIRGGKWPQAEVDYLVASWQTATDAEVANVIGRPRKAVLAKRREMGLIKPRATPVMKAGPGQIMTPSQRRREQEAAMRAFNFPWDGKFKSRQEVDEYVAGDAIQCLLCGVFRIRLGAHVLRTHGWSVAAYKSRYGIPKTRGLDGAARRAVMTKHVARLIEKSQGRFSRGRRVRWTELNQPRAKPPIWVGQENRARFQEQNRLRMVRRADLNPEAVMRDVRAAVPRGLERHVRDEVVAAMVLAVYEGHLHLRDVGRHVGEFIRGQYREFPAKYGHLSLDAPMDGTELRLVDVIPDTAFRF